MTKPRQQLPKATREAVLNEYRHRCAICGGDRPQIHHIDENPANNELANLLPLCPDCHLTDQHDPTAPAGPERLLLFRKYKDPSILSPQFAPLLQRYSLLYSGSLSGDELRNAADDLVRFVEGLGMGKYFAVKLDALIGTAATNASFDSSAAFGQRDMKVVRRQMERRLGDHKAKLEVLLIGLLRCQKRMMHECSS